MKKQLFSLVAMASLLSITKPVLAATDSAASAQDTAKMIQKMTVQAHVLESQMKTLDSQIGELKAEQRELKAQVKTEKVAAQETTQPAVQTESTQNTQTTLPAYTTSVQSTKFCPLPTFLSGTPVTIGSYLGSHTSFSPFDLAVTYTNYMENLHILQVRQDIFNDYKKNNVAEPTGPILMLSGKVEGQGIYATTYNSAHTSKIDLTGAELDLIPIINKWAGGFVSLRYDNNPAPNMPLTNNSRVRLDQGYLTFGNLNRSPVYLTLGQFYVPFGNYSSLMITSPMTDSVFQTRARAVELAYQHPCNQGPYAQVFAFNGDANANNNNNIKNFGGNVGFGYSKGSAWNIDTSVGAITDVSDSIGMQQTFLPMGFAGFSAGNNENLVRQVPGVAAHFNFGIGQFGMFDEYVTATSAFAPQDLMYNGYGAKPSALNLEGFYNFHVMSKPSAIVASYGQTWQALAVGAPQYRYNVSFLTSVWRNTLQQIEFRHDINYSTSDISGGRGSVPTASTGGSANTVTLLLGIYF
ncbi:MAG TPA: LbtU family siderophore porin [Gammaproteobacteria bacterium]|nr:LbtU family siderophore porin [Gammaproteobacteria bacterium]